MTQIKNINGNSEHECKCENWLTYWNKHSNKPAIFCSEIGCTQMFGLKGTPVQKSTGDDEWFIVPLCEKHCNETGELLINDFIKLIPPNIEEPYENKPLGT